MNTNVYYIVMYYLGRRFAFIQISILQKTLIIFGMIVFFYLILANLYIPNDFPNSSDHIAVVNKITYRLDKKKAEDSGDGEVREQLKYDNNLNYRIPFPPDRKIGITIVKETTKHTFNKGNEQFREVHLSKCPSLEELSITGKIGQGLLLLDELKIEEVQLAHLDVSAGGFWAPKDCIAINKIAIIIPYRDRESHLTRLLDFLIPILKKQMLDFRFIVTEQIGTDLFNKGRIMNAAFKYAETLNVTCVIFHDVDMFPQDYGTPYDCPNTPRHLGAFVNNLGYQLWYPEIAGGVLSINMDDYRKVNGYSNMYWAWGGEDDDMGKRIMSNNYTIERPDPNIAKYSMLKHVKRKRTAPKLIYTLLKSAGERWHIDGLNETDKWKVEKILIKPLYHHIYVNVFQPPKEWKP
uniref:Beta-1,4-N-acetylgalactosaminyltransferase n=1 Tax=Parastrongyloides trichosuri TaxID=131310 RepID=A0A0N4ZC19_PARTI